MASPTVNLPDNFAKLLCDRSACRLCRLPSLWLGPEPQPLCDHMTSANLSRMVHSCEDKSGLRKIYYQMRLIVAAVARGRFMARSAASKVLR
mmetsp:Transcript_4151/g.9448  ORF Transcript_4151/g.9448 Transcript_4151/m.9448 type:complete len:92 (+) Transcript_4151:134-409(+)